MTRDRELGLGTLDVKTYSPRVEIADVQDGEFLARVAVFNNVDHSGDRLLPGAFKASLEAWQSRDAHIPIVYAHAWNEPPIGHVLEAREESDGLVVRATLYADEDPLAAKVLRGLRKKSLSEFSFGFLVKQAALVFEKDEVVRELREVDLVEIGPCLKGVNPETELLAVKSRLLGRKSGRTLSTKTLEKLRGIAQDLVTFCDEHDAPPPVVVEDTEKAARAAQSDWLLRHRLFALSLAHS